MSSTDTTTTAPTESALQKFEDTLAADLQSALTVVKGAMQFFGQFLSKVAAGAEVVIADIEAAGQYVAAHLGVINAGIDSIGQVANVVAPNNPNVAKVLNDLTVGANDVALLSNALASGTSANDPTLVTQAVTAIHAVQQLSQLVGQAGATITQLTANSPTATEAVTASPAAGASSQS